MRGFFDGEEREKPRSKRGDTDKRGYTELTLGTGTLVMGFFGLVLLCGLCIGLGYVIGSRGAKGPVFQSQPPAAGPSQQLSQYSNQGKPSAAAQPPQAPLQPTDGTTQVASTSPGTAAPGTAAPGTASTAAATAPAQGSVTQVSGQQTAAPQDSGWRAVQPAIPGGTTGTQAAQTASVTQVQAAMPAQQSLMVQIAAVSSQQDAQVLMNALRQRGYAVSAVRYPTDNLIHVCVGPFTTRVDANSMREKLLSDGYNAVVLQ